MSKPSKDAAKTLKDYLAGLAEQLQNRKLPTLGMSDDDKAAVTSRIYQLTVLQDATPGERNSPGYYEDLARLLADIGENEAAAIVYERAAAASIGHNRAARYHDQAAHLRQTRSGW